MSQEFEQFKRTLPYASELYGVYQPLMGWKSQLTRTYIDKGVSQTMSNALSDLMLELEPNYEVQRLQSPREFDFSIQPATPGNRQEYTLPNGFDSVIGRRVSREIIKHGVDDPKSWHKFTSADTVTRLLRESTDEIKATYLSALADHAQAICPPTITTPQPALAAVQPDMMSNTLHALLETESVVAGALVQLNARGNPMEIMRLLKAPHRPDNAVNMMLSIGWIVDRSNISAAVLSPIGVVHLFRQYFFEFDTFLGPPVQHLWLTPGGTVELIEINTRKRLVERFTEQMLETVDRTESSTTTQDELSDAMRSENMNNTRLGVNVGSSTNFGNKAIFTTTIDTAASFALDQSQKDAREHLHKGLRQQTEKTSNEVRQSFKSTFKTVTESTDTTSRRYVIENKSTKLANYELRRKMRQVGIQIQDLGTKLCWQAYVDNPGDELGIARLVHIAEPADLSHIKQPNLPPAPEPLQEVTHPPISNGWIHKDKNMVGFIPFLGQIDLSVLAKPGYIYSHAAVRRISGEAWGYSVRPFNSDDDMADTRDQPWKIHLTPDVEMIDADDGKGTKERKVRSVWVGITTEPSGLNTSDKPHCSVEVKLYFKPSQAYLKKYAADRAQAETQLREDTARAFQEALFIAAQERIKLAGDIVPRTFEDLREEERIVVYRKLILQLMEAAGVGRPSKQLRHVFSELVRAMFDIDDMLYFVAPEWWIPRQPLPRTPVPPSSTPAPAPARRMGRALGRVHQSPQDIGVASGEFNKNTVSWGGAVASRPDNYYITKDSKPARMGSSLGWLLQLDGDKLRNAFLNAPWVKAVVPIRGGQEWEALDWLSSPNIEGSDGLGALYVGGLNERRRMRDALKEYYAKDAALGARYDKLAADELTVLDAIRYLILTIQVNRALGSTKVTDPDDNSISYLPADKVFEHGFDPLEGGFQAQSEQPFSVFDQWIEVLPTDQIVPVQVEYDPVTGRLKR